MFLFPFQMYNLWILCWKWIIATERGVTLSFHNLCNWTFVCSHHNLVNQFPVLCLFSTTAQSSENFCRWQDSELSSILFPRDLTLPITIEGRICLYFFLLALCLALAPHPLLLLLNSSGIWGLSLGRSVSLESAISWSRLYPIPIGMVIWHNKS